MHPATVCTQASNVCTVPGLERRVSHCEGCLVVVVTCALSFFSMVVYWLTKADCDLEILTFSPVMEGSPVIAIRLALTALVWTAKGGDISGELAISGCRAAAASLRRPCGEGALLSGAESSAGPAGGPTERWAARAAASEGTFGLAGQPRP